jgi:hypothetical protein
MTKGGRGQQNSRRMTTKKKTITTKKGMIKMGKKDERTKGV